MSPPADQKWKISEVLALSCNYSAECVICKRLNLFIDASRMDYI